MTSPAISNPAIAAAAVSLCLKCTGSAAQIGAIDQVARILTSRSAGPNEGSGTSRNRRLFPSMTIARTVPLH